MGYGDNFKVHGPYKRPDGRQIVIVIENNGKRRTVSYPKWVMELHLGRRLDPNLETVDHWDSDINNNDPSNLRLVPRSEHSRDDTRRVKPVSFTCAWCDKRFERSPRLIRDKAKKNKAGPFCSRSCAGKYSRQLQLKLIDKLDSQQAVDSEYYKQKYVKASLITESQIIDLICDIWEEPLSITAAITRQADFYYKICNGGVLEFPPLVYNEIMNFIDQKWLEYQSTGKEDYSSLINLDLFGLSKKYPVDVLDGINNLDIQVKIKFTKTPSPFSGRWIPDEGILLLMIPVINDSFDKERIGRTVQHELRHVLQTTLDLLRYKKPGLPAEWDPSTDASNEEYSQHGSKYLASGVEFFPYLNDTIITFKSLFKTPNKYDLIHFINMHPFFQALKKEAPPLYKRAIKELWKAVNNDLIPSQEEDSSLYEIDSFIRENKKSIYQYIEQNLNKKIPLSSITGPFAKLIGPLLAIQNINPTKDGALIFKKRDNGLAVGFKDSNSIRQIFYIPLQ